MFDFATEERRHVQFLTLMIRQELKNKDVAELLGVKLDVVRRWRNVKKAVIPAEKLVLLNAVLQKHMKHAERVS